MPVQTTKHGGCLQDFRFYWLTHLESNHRLVGVELPIGFGGRREREKLSDLNRTERLEMPPPNNINGRLSRAPCIPLVQKFVAWLMVL